jgi:hypothetical protein
VVEEIIGRLPELSGSQLGRLEDEIRREWQHRASSAGEGQDAAHVQEGTTSPVTEVLEYRPYEDGYLQPELRPYIRRDGSARERWHCSDSPKSNSETIGTLADLAHLVEFALWAITVMIGLLGLWSFRSAYVEAGPTQTVDVYLGGRGKAVGGDGNRGAVVVGDHNRVEVFGTLERARRQVEALTLGEVPSRAALPPGSVMPSGPDATLSAGTWRGRATPRLKSRLGSLSAWPLSPVTPVPTVGIFVVDFYSRGN